VLAQDNGDIGDAWILAKARSEGQEKAHPFKFGYRIADFGLTPPFELQQPGFAMLNNARGSPEELPAHGGLAWEATSLTGAGVVCYLAVAVA
jgi:hypothetical protein